MITKASQRGGGQQLATHLLNARDNERVEVLQIRGSVARDLHGAFAEWEAISSATKCRKNLYSLSINPDPQQRKLSRAEIREFVTRVETTLGLKDQPRAVVCHVKGGREHYHVAWSRIDAARMKAVQLSHDRYKIRATVREFAREKGLDLPHGIARDLRGRFNERARAVTHAEKQQEERTGISKDQRRREITEAWQRSDSGPSFVRALAGLGYHIARGDRRGYVVVDRHGEIHSLARQIEGVRTRQIEDRLRDLPPDSLPPVAKAREFARQRDSASIKEKFARAVAAERARLDEAHRTRRAALDQIKAGLEQRHRAEREALLSIQRDRNKAAAEERRAQERKGFSAFLAKITGIEALKNRRIKEQDAQRTEAQRENIGELTRRQERERRDLARQYRALGRVEKRELRSLETALRRALRAEIREPVRAPQRERITTAFTETTRPPAVPPGAEEPTGKTLSSEFIEAMKERAAEKKRRAEERTKDRPRGRDRGPRR